MKRLAALTLILGFLLAALALGIGAANARRPHPSHCPHNFSPTCLHHGRSSRGSMTVPGRTP